MPWLRALSVLVVLVGWTSQSVAAPTDTLTKMGCYNCHLDGPSVNPLHERLPDLTQAGERYTEDHLWDYLRQPRTIRKDLSPARMPRFPLSDVEWVHLIEYLATQKAVKAPQALLSILGAPTRAGQDLVEVGRTLFEKEYGCMGCHAWDGKGGVVGPDLSDAGARLKLGWLRRYLADPLLYAPKSKMPSLFFARQKGAYVSARPDRDVVKDLDAITAFLMFGRVQKQGRYALEKAKVKKPDPAIGEQIFLAMNCVACHRNDATAVKVGKNAPSLRRVGRGVQDAFLRAYLKEPRPIRPFGFRPGDGGRMPDFRLTARESNTLAASIRKLGVGVDLIKAPRPKALTAFQKKKAETLVRDKLSCLGCHQLGAEGGRVAPRLDGVGHRLSAEYIFNILNHPRRTVPTTVMPKIRFRPTPKVGFLVYEWLVGLTPKEVPQSSYLSVIDHERLPTMKTEDKAAELYGHNCAHCHGQTGAADGFNARYLSPGPAQHSDKMRMAKRPDDTLFDGIHVGAFVLNQNHRMPGFGASLSREDIWSLVRYIRTLCKCEQPKWASDGLKR